MKFLRNYIVNVIDENNKLRRKQKETAEEFILYRSNKNYFHKAVKVYEFWDRQLNPPEEYKAIERLNLPNHKIYYIHDNKTSNYFSFEMNATLPGIKPQYILKGDRTIIEKLECLKQIKEAEEKLASYK